MALVGILLVFALGILISSLILPYWYLADDTNTREGAEVTIKVALAFIALAVAFGQGYVTGYEDAPKPPPAKPVSAEVSK